MTESAKKHDAMLDELKQLRERIDFIESNLNSQGSVQEIEISKQVIVSANHFRLEQTRRILDKLPVPLWLSDTGTIRLLNEKLQDELAIKSISFTFEEWFYRVHPDDAEKAIEHINYATKNKLRWDLEYRFNLSAGNYIWLREVAEPQFDKQCRFDCFIGHVENIRGLKQHENELVEIKQILERSPITILMTDINGDIEYVNPKFTESTGYSDEDVLGKNPRIFKSGETPSEDYAKMWKTISSGKQWHGEFHNRQKNGELFWESATIVPLFDTGGNINHYLAAKVDITSEKLVRQENEKIFFLLQQTINAMPDPIIVLSGDHTIRLVNIACTSILARSIIPGMKLKCHLELIGDFEAGKDPPHCNVLNAGVLKSVEMYIQQVPGGKDLYWEFESLPLSDQSGTIIIVRDIGERIKLNEERLRTRKLESLADLSGGIAHDFNNILTAIIGNITLAGMQTKPDSSQFNRLQAAEKAALKAKDLTQQLMAFSKGGAPIKNVKRPAPIFEKIVLEETDNTAYTCESQIDQDLWKVEIDEEQIILAVQNVIRNAKSAMPGGGTISVAAKNSQIQDNDQLSAGPYVSLQISDQGQGLSDEQISRIFDPYYANGKSGFGLGLATAYSIIKQHNGLIEVETAENGGTQFTLHLPASRLSEQPVKQIRSGTQRTSARILVMDDEYDVRMIVGELLRAMGYEVVLAENGEQTLQSYEQAIIEGRPFDLIIMDLIIQNGMNGEQTIKQLINRFPDAKAIVSSGYFSDPIMANYKEYGFSGVVRKPYQMQELEQVLHTVLEKP